MPVDMQPPSLPAISLPPLSTSLPNLHLGRGNSYYEQDTQYPYREDRESGGIHIKRRKLDHDPFHPSLTAEQFSDRHASTRGQAHSYIRAHEEHDDVRLHETPWSVLPPPLQPYTHRRQGSSPMRVQSLLNYGDGEEAEEEHRTDEENRRTQPWSAACPTSVSPEADPDGKPFHCEVPGCDKKYKKLNGLIYHNQTAHSPIGLNDPKPFKCNVAGCDKAYRNSNGLAYHLEKGHANGAPFSQSAGRKLETVEKPYVCPYKGCGKAYKNPNGLAYHLSKGKQTGHHVETDVTSGIKTYICAVTGCRKTYKSPQGLAEHIEQMHADMEPVVSNAGPPTSKVLECPSCMKAFRSASSLEYHITTIHHHNPHSTNRGLNGIPAMAIGQVAPSQYQQDLDERHPHHAGHYETYGSCYEPTDSDIPSSPESSSLMVSERPEAIVI